MFREGGRGTGGAVGASGGLLWTVGDFPLPGQRTAGGRVALGNARKEGEAARVRSAGGEVRTRCELMVYNRDADMDSIAPAWDRSRPEEDWGMVELPSKARRLVERAMGEGAGVSWAGGVGSALERDGFASAVAHWQSAAFLGPGGAGKELGFGTWAAMAAPPTGRESAALSGDEDCEEDFMSEGAAEWAPESSSPRRRRGCSETVESLADDLPFEVLVETGEAGLLFDILKESVGIERVEDPVVGSTLAALPVVGGNAGAFRVLCPVGERCHHLAMYEAAWAEGEEEGQRAKRDPGEHTKPRLVSTKIGPSKMAPAICGLAQRIHRVSVHSSTGTYLVKSDAENDAACALAAAQGGHTTAIYLVGGTGLHDALAVKHSSRPTGLAWNLHPGFGSEDTSVGEFAVPCEDGSLQMTSWTQGSDGARSINLLGSIPVGQQPVRASRWSACEWGHHPRSLLRCTPTSVELLDVRSDRRRSPILLWEPDHPGKDREIVALARPQGPIAPLYFPHLFALSTASRVCVFDQRFAKHPLVDWEHGFEYFRSLHCRDPIPFLPRFLRFSAMSEFQRTPNVHTDAGVLFAACYAHGSPVKMFEFSQTENLDESNREHAYYSGSWASASKNALFGGEVLGSRAKSHEFDLRNAIFCERDSSERVNDDRRSTASARMKTRRSSLVAADLSSSWIPCASKHASPHARSYLRPLGYEFVPSRSEMNPNGVTFLYNGLAGDVFAEQVLVGRVPPGTVKEEMIHAPRQNESNDERASDATGLQSGVHDHTCPACSSALSLRQKVDLESIGEDSIQLVPSVKMPGSSRILADGTIVDAFGDPSRDVIPPQHGRLHARREDRPSTDTDDEAVLPSLARHTWEEGVREHSINVPPNIRFLMNRYDEEEVFQASSGGQAIDPHAGGLARGQRAAKPRRVVLGPDGEELDIGGPTSFSQPNPNTGPLDLSQAPADLSQPPADLSQAPADLSQGPLQAPRTPYTVRRRVDKKGKRKNLLSQGGF